jgi:ubiquinone/menaquinone biosynthesis C-methylase UbiE
VSDAVDRLRRWWDEDAPSYDRAPGHSLEDAAEAERWRAALARFLPSPPARVLDVGAGTGAMSFVAAGLGHRVTALDLSPAMLERARAKASTRSVDIVFVVGPATDPPPGPFDAVIERHVLWTLPKPVDALRAWRAVAPQGRLVLLEAVFARKDLAVRARDALSRVSRTAGQDTDHHGPYDADLLASLPLAHPRSIAPILAAVREAGWKNVRAHRLRDIERGRRRQLGFIRGWLRHVRRYAIVADA